MKRLIVGLVLVAVMAAGCGSPPPDPNALLKTARDKVNASPTVHFVLTSSNATGQGLYATGGEGDAKRPNQMTGTFNISYNGFPLSLHIASVNGTFYAQSPISGGWVAENPAKYNLADPGTLIDPTNGLAGLLNQTSNVKLESNDRYNGEELYEVSCQVPGASIQKLLQDADPSKPVDATFGVDTSTNELRRIVLSGPLISVGVTTTFTIILTNYGENVTVTPPPVAK